MPISGPSKLDRCWRKSRIAARILLRERAGRLTPRDVRLARRVAVDKGGTARLNQGIITYQPAAGFTGSDSFEVQATQAGGVVLTLPVEVVVVEPGSLPHRLLPAAPPAAIRSQVLPGRWYRMERSSDPVLWLPAGEVRADADGTFLWQNEALPGGRAFYRAVLIP